jgi:hypothetical protein
MAEGTFATAVNCMDGRTQEPVSRWMKKEFGVDYVDTITEPGADKALTEGPPEQVESVKQRVLISVNGHGSRNVVIVGHHDCAGNPVSKERHLEMTRKAVEVVKSWGLPVRILGVWVDEKWEVTVIADTAN